LINRIGLFVLGWAMVLAGAFAASRWPAFGPQLASLVVFAGALLILIGAFRMAHDSSPYSPPPEPFEAEARQRDGRWILAFVATAAVPALTYVPVMKLAASVLPGRLVDQLIVWALVASAIIFGLSFLLRRGAPSLKHRWITALDAAMISFIAVCVALYAADALFHTGFRLWFLGPKLTGTARLAHVLVDLVALTACSLLLLRSFGPTLAVKGESIAVACLTGALAFSAGFIVLGVVQVAFHPLAPHAAATVLALQLAPILGVVGLIAAVTWRVSGDYLPGALVSGVFLTWFILAGAALLPPHAAIAAPAQAAKSPVVALAPAAPPQRSAG
jgi:hypothetical protein